MNEPQITIVGNMTRDPELRYTSSGTPVANFTIASTPRVKKNDQWVDGEAMFVRCTVWREYAENVADTLAKGMRIVATGRLSVETYQANTGEERTSLKLDVDEVGPSLRFATASVTRKAANQPHQAAPPQAQQQYGQPQQPPQQYAQPQLEAWPATLPPF